MTLPDAGETISDIGAPWQDLLIAWADADTRPRALLGAHRRLLWGNRAFKSWISRMDDVWEASGCLQLLYPKLTEEFDIALRRTGPAPSNWTCRRPDGMGALVFHMQRVSPPSEGLAVGLTVQATGAEFQPQWADYANVFALTPSEDRTVRALLGGLSVSDAADSLGLAVPTLRSHVRNAYAKLAVGSREELFRVLAPFRID